MCFDKKVPEGELEGLWQGYKSSLPLVSPANKRRFKVIVVGSGLAGSSAAATLAELGYQVECMCFQDSPRRAHSIAAQGGINAAKNYPGDGDSVYRLFYDTIKGGDFRAREANVYRLAEISGSIIDQCVAQGVPFARDYGGLLANRSFGGAQVSRTFYARGQTGQQLLLGAYGALSRQIAQGRVKFHARHEMLDIVVVDGHARGVVVRDLVTGKLSYLLGDTVVLATGGYANVFFLSTNAKGCNVSATYRAYLRGAGFANPCFTQIHPTCIPVSGDYQSKLTLMSESLRNDGRVWVSKQKGDKRPPQAIPQSERDYYLERRYPSYGNLAPRDIASRAAKQVCDDGFGIGKSGMGVYLDFSDAIARLGEETVRQRYGNLFHMYQEITAENPYQTPMRIFPAAHYTMGGLWVDYNLMSNLKGLHVIGEANFSDHGANRLGASALMQGLADGYYVLPYTIGAYLSQTPQIDKNKVITQAEAVRSDCERKIAKLLEIDGSRSVDYFHRRLGKIMWDNCGMARSKDSLQLALQQIPALAEEFWRDLRIGGNSNAFNQELEKAGRVADFLDFAQLMCRDALQREESCGGHFRVEYQTADGEAARDDKNFSHVSIWEHGDEPRLHEEPLTFKRVALTQRSYK